MGGSDPAKNFDFDVRYLGVEGLRKWFFESFATRDSKIARGAFRHDEPCSTLDIFQSVAPQFGEDSRAIFLTAIHGALSNDDEYKKCDIYFLYCMTRLLHAVEVKSDCKKSFQALAQRFDEFIDGQDWGSDVTDLKLLSFDDYKDALRYICSIVEHDDVNSINERVFVLNPVLEHAHRTFWRSDKTMERDGLNVAYIFLALASISYDAKQDLEPFYEKVSESAEVNYKDKYSEVSVYNVGLYPHPSRDGVTLPYYLGLLHPRLQRMKSLLSSSGAKIKTSSLRP